MSANKKFADNPILFLSQNIVRLAYTDMHIRAHGGIGKFKLTDMTKEGIHGYNFFGSPIGMYFLQDGTNDPTALSGYWCPYADNKFGFAVIGKDADFMFTETMNGCTFAIGSETFQGARLVGHVNSKNVGGESGAKAQARDQRRRARKIFDKKDTLYEPKHYREKPGENTLLDSTTFGVRNQKTEQWNFYAQIYEYHHDKLVLRAIKKLA